MRRALFLPVFDELSDPALVAELVGRAEAAGCAGVFACDHVAHRAPVQAVGPPVRVAARHGNPGPLRRAACHDGVLPIGITDPAQESR